MMPDSMNIKESNDFLLLLYRSGLLPDIKNDIANMIDDDDDNDDDDDDADADADDDNDGDLPNTIDYCSFTKDPKTGMIKFEFYDFGCKVKIDPKTGRIKFLYLDFSRQGRIMDYFCNLPPIVERFQMLESIDLHDCKLLPVKLGHLPRLQTIHLCNCILNIPEGLQLPTIKEVIIGESHFDSDQSLNQFFRMFCNNSLEKLSISMAYREELLGDILRALQNNDLTHGFRHLKSIQINWTDFNEDDLKIMLFKVRPCFPKLRKIHIREGEINTLLGIEDRIKSTSASLQSVIRPDNSLRVLILFDNCLKHQVYKHDDPKEKAALLALLDTFDGVSNLGHTNKKKYDPDIEYKLRINQAGQKFLVGSRRNINPALWSTIFERAYNTSSEIYDNKYSSCESIKQKKCATGLNHLIRHHFLSTFLIYNSSANNNPAKAKAKATATESTDTGSGDNDSSNKRKRKHKRN
jgi:hypothetical protein